ncbi:MAG TPA: 4-(cytidine 5'-diphospho)-2-C-methyl-D-erythritol kinase [Pseudothermotoga sp.]|nr:4-(cytidine 5'-diphospho)-2-C-methyl-D-erythritol kinase [Pseudothermotoga sp.]HOK82798.1 4-(cytidine 5'-diphospho)-2-C-methyl-D-erythritol kinase [Pseudothermotoga sp.]HPP70029.1 4-(cytidine 5'-diphospho)-2-C-methyl-D-erythritol kinase [Pseudothermotoga sp.]
MVIPHLVETERAYAKVNLYLDVLSKRDDGYHNIVGLFQTIDLYDLIEFHMTDEPGKITIQTHANIMGMNLIEKAYRIASEYYKIDFGLKVRLFKNIPMGSGLGGGSADAAATIRFLARILNMSDEAMMQIAERVGSDVPFLLRGGTALVEGKGEKITFLEPITGYSLNLFCSQVSISTALMYQKLTEDMYNKGPKPVEELYEAYRIADLHGVRSLSYNIFQKMVCAEHAEVKNNLDKAWTENPIIAMMTGTGSCVFSVHRTGGRYKFIAGSPNSL